MKEITEILFERFYSLFAICLVINLILFYSLKPANSTIKKIIKFAIPIISAALLIMNVIVKTDKELIVEATKRLVEAIKREDTAAIEALIDEEFWADSFNKRSALAAAREAFSHIRLESVYIMGMELSIPKVRFVAYARITSTDGRDYGNVRSDWELTFIKRENRYLLLSAQPLSVDLREVRSLSELFNLARGIW